MSIARVSGREGGSEQKGSRHAPGPLSIEDAVAELVLDNGPQNRINDQLCADLVAGLERAQVDGARPILIHGAADHFSCGGDPSQLLPPVKSPLSAFDDDRLLRQARPRLV